MTGTIIRLVLAALVVVLTIRFVGGAIGIFLGMFLGLLVIFGGSC